MDGSEAESFESPSEPGQGDSFPLPITRSCARRSGSRSNLRPASPTSSGTRKTLTDTPCGCEESDTRDAAAKLSASPEPAWLDDVTKTLTPKKAATSQKDAVVAVRWSMAILDRRVGDTNWEDEPSASSLPLFPIGASLSMITRRDASNAPANSSLLLAGRDPVCDGARESGTDSLRSRSDRQGRSCRSAAWGAGGRGFAGSQTCRILEWTSRCRTALCSRR